MKKTAFFPALAFSLVCCISAQSQSLNSYLVIDSLLKDKQFFAARDLLDANKKNLSAFHQLKLGAEIDNVSNQLAASNAKIDALIQGYSDQLNDSVLYHLSDIRQSNSAKPFDYQKASGNSYLAFNCLILIPNAATVSVTNGLIQLKMA